MSRPEQLLLPAHVLTAMIQHAQSELPNECCGLLAGTVEGTTANVSAIYPLVNEAASPIEYRSEPRSMLKADKEMRRLGQDILAIYHSHPTSAPQPSQTDLERAALSDVVYFIVGLAGPEPEVRGWWLNGDAFAEARWQTVYV